jgi:hypothetical protein
MALVSLSVERIKLMVDAVAAELLSNGEPRWPTYVGNPGASGDLPDRYIAVGYGGDDRPGIVGQAEMGLSRQNGTSGHRWQVWCTASCASGDLNTQARLDEVENVMDEFEERLEVNRGLALADGTDPMLVAGGMASVAAHEWTIEDDGTVATVFWTVEVLVRW